MNNEIMDLKKNEIVNENSREEKSFADGDILDMLRHAGHILHRLPQHGGPQRRVLELLDGESCSQKLLTQALGIQPGSASELLGRMEAEGLIRREPLPMDRRGMKVIVTEEGQRRLSEERVSPEGELLSCLTDEEKRALAAALKKLLDHWREDLLPPRGARPRHPYEGDRREGRPFPPPHGGSGFDPHDGPFGRSPHEGPHGRPGRLPDGEFVPLDERRRSERRDYFAHRDPRPGEDVCVQNCSECELKAQGRCVKRV
ncbi:MAG: MarR family transcriptional regulator [Clostridia bacterium]|nr:MarR family transcriptional regulator [Clostridia bacterium]